MKTTHKDIEKEVKRIARALAEKEKRHDKVIALQREVVRDCARAIKDLHAGDAKALQKGLDALKPKVLELATASKGIEGTAMTAFQEYAETACLAAVLQKKPVPSAEALGIPDNAWINGLADTAGELRRAVQLALRARKRKQAETLFDAMTAIHDNLMLLKFSSALVGPLKHKQDVIRRQIEEARSELLRSL